MWDGLGDIIKGLVDPKVLGRHCLNYIHLYTKPLMLWRKMVSPLTDGVPILVTQLLYLLVVLIVVFNISTDLAVPYLVAEVALTCIPFLWLIIPFLFFRWLFKKALTTGQLFRLLVVLKLQFIVVIGVLAFLLAKYKSETAYLVLDNLIWTLGLLFISVLPLVLKLTWWKKVVWILGNYVFFLLALVGVGFLLAWLPDSNRLEKAISVPNPTTEYFELVQRYSGAYQSLVPQILFLTKRNEAGKGYLVQTQYVTIPLSELFLHENRKKLAIDSAELALRHDILMDSATHALDSARIAQRLAVIDAMPDGYLGLRRLDSMRSEFDARFYADLKAAGHDKDSARFASNRAYFRSMHDYLQFWDSAFTTPAMYEPVFMSDSVRLWVRSDSSVVVSLSSYDLQFAEQAREELTKATHTIINYSNWSSFMMTWMIAPLDWLEELGWLLPPEFPEE